MSESSGVTNGKEKDKRILRNISAHLFNTITAIAFGLIVPRLFLVNFGSEVNGLVHTVKQILAYLALLEAGVGASSQQALYSPVAKGDKGKVNSIISAMHHYYRRTGVVYLALSLLFAIVYPIFIKTGLGYLTVFAIVMLYALPEVFKYLVQGKYRVFLEVEGKTYVLSNISTIMLWVCNLLRILMLCFTDNLLLIQATYCLPSLVQLVIITLYIKKNYGWIDVKAKPDLSSLKQKNSVLVHQISGLIFNNTDTVLISFICGLKSASVYTVYMLFSGYLDKFIHAFTDGINFRLGQIFHTNRKLFLKLYDLYEETYIMCISMMYTVIGAFLLPIITLYTKGVKDINYVNPVYVILFVLSGVLVNTKYPATQLIGYSGDFDRTRHHAIIEMSINLATSVVMALKFGIIGCLIGTIAALTYRNIAILIFTNREVLRSSCFKAFRRIIVNLGVGALIIWGIGMDSCAPKGYFHVVLHAGLNAIWIVIAFLAINVLLDFRTFRYLPEIVKKLRRKDS